mgnify:FL=1
MKVIPLISKSHFSSSLLALVILASTLGASSKKNVLGELLTASNCSGCPIANRALDHYLDPTHSDYVGDDLANNWILIRFHSNDIGWGDPMYHAIGSPDYASNCDEDPVCYRFGGNSSSDAPYNPSFLPTLYINGVVSTTAEAFKTDATAVRSSETSVTMSLEGTTFDSLTANIKLSISSDEDLSDQDLRLFVAVTMDSIGYNGDNGETEHHDVFLGWVNSYFGGDTLVLAKNDTVNKTYKWALRDDYPKNSYYPKNDSEIDQITWDKKNMTAVAFVQQKSDNEIIQATHNARKDAGSADVSHEELQPSEFSLMQNYPNPFNSGTTISYILPERSDVQIIIYSLLGHPVRTLVNNNSHSGFHTVSWDGKDSSGDTVSGGIYLYRIRTANFTAVRKMLLLK